MQWPGDLIHDWPTRQAMQYDPSAGGHVTLPTNASSCQIANHLLHKSPVQYNHLPSYRVPSDVQNILPCMRSGQDVSARQWTNGAMSSLSLMVKGSIVRPVSSRPRFSIKIAVTLHRRTTSVERTPVEQWAHLRSSFLLISQNWGLCRALNMHIRQWNNKVLGKY